jgi:hypothetical protein
VTVARTYSGICMRMWWPISMKCVVDLLPECNRKVPKASKSKHSDDNGAIQEANRVGIMVRAT